MQTDSLTMGMFLSQAIPLTVATALIAFLWNKRFLDTWLSRIGWSFILGTIATLIMYYLHTGTLSGMGELWIHTGGIVGIFRNGLNFIAFYYTIAGPWMVLGCVAVGIILGLVLAKLMK